MYMNENFDFGLTKYRYEMENLDPVFATPIDTFTSIKKPEVTGSIILFELFEMIRYNFNAEAFLTTKYLNGIKNPEYTEIKSVSPTVCYNANFNGYKNLKHLLSPTGLMFLDIDDFKTKEEAEAYKKYITLKYDWIIACNLSLSRLGLHVIIYVDKILSNEDFNLKYDLINSEYFDGKLDKIAKSLIRNTIIPYDRNIYINFNPSILNTADILKNSGNSIGSDNNEKSIRSGDKERKVISTPYTFLVPELGQMMTDAAVNDGLRFSIPLAESNFADPNIPIYISEGRSVVEINLHRFKNSKVNDGNRTTIIGAISMQMIYLNAHSMSKIDSTTKEAIQKFMSMVNKKICNPPLSHREVINSFNANWRKYVDGKMDFTNCFVIKHSFWSSQCTIKGNEKRKTTCRIKNEPIVTDSKKKIKVAIEIVYGRGCKITQKSVANVAGMNVQTVKKYWKEYKLNVKELNIK